MDRLQAMRTFMAVLDEGTFTAAAAALGVRQPTVSKHISRLESILGVRLIERSTHEVSPTVAGAEYYRRCVVLLGALDEADAVVSVADGRPSGTVRMSAPPALWSALSQRLAPLLQQHSALSVHLLSPAAPAALQLSFRPVADQRPLFSGTIHVYAAASWLAKHGLPAGPTALPKRAGIDWPGGTWPDGDAVVLRVPDMSAAADAARAGIGLVRLPDWAAVGLTPLWSVPTASAQPVWATHRQGRYPSPSVTAILSALGEGG